MNRDDIIRAWKDARFRRSLSEEERARVPQNPAGMVELTDDQLTMAGGIQIGRVPITTAPTCTMFTFLNWAACGCFPQTTAPGCTANTFHGWKACCP